MKDDLFSEEVVVGEGNEKIFSAEDDCYELLVGRAPAKVLALT